MREELEKYKTLPKDKYNDSEYKALQEKFNKEEKRINS
jgi:hypothetical protein